MESQGKPGKQWSGKVSELILLLQKIQGKPGELLKKKEAYYREIKTSHNFHRKNVVIIISCSMYNFSHKMSKIVSEFVPRFNRENVSENQGIFFSRFLMVILTSQN